MNIDITLPDDRASIVSAIANMIQSSLDDKSVRQHAELILDEYIVRTNHHIWMVGQCAKILKEVVIKYYHDTEMFDTNIEFHDYDKLHNPDILPVYALACHYFYFHKKDVKYKVDEEWLEHEFEDVAWPKHHMNNKHHYAEYYGKKTGKDSFDVPETYDVLSLVEMYADWMAMGVVNGGTAHEWWTANYGEDKKYDFHGRDLGVIQSCILVEDKSENQLAYLRQFKEVEPTWVPPSEIKTFEEEDPIASKGINEGIENFFNYVSDESLSLKRDELYIGPIDPMIIDPEKMMKLAEYPDLLLALKKWTTTPDHNLSPALIFLGKLVDEIYQFKKPIVCYRGIRTGFSTRPKQNLMGAIDDEIEYLRLLKPGFDKPGQTFSFESPEPMSLARSPYIAKIYGNYIIKTEVPADANKLVITPELSYLLQQMEVEYPEYRAVNLSVTHEVIVFTGTKLTFEIVSVFGDISSELETMKEHSFEGLGNTEMNGVYFNLERTYDNGSINDLVSAEVVEPNSQDWKHYDTLKKMDDEEARAHFKAQCGEYVYHGSPLKLSQLVPQDRSDMDKPLICFTPFLGVASWFCCPETSLGRGEYKHKAVQIKNWFDNRNNYDGVKEIDKVVEIHHNIKDIPDQRIRHTGFIHCVKTDKIIDQLITYNRWSTSMEAWYFGKPVRPDKVIQINITAVLKYDKQIVKEKGGDAVRIEDVGTEALSSQKEKVLKLKKISGSDEEVNLCLPLLNDARTASGHEEENKEGVLKWLRHPQSEWFLAYDSSLLVGMVEIVKVPTNDAKLISSLKTDCVEIGHFAISREHRGKNYGVSLVRTTVDYIQKKYSGKPIIVRCASKNTAAIGCYKKAGFVLNFEDKTGGDEKHGHGITLIFKESQSESVEALSPDIKKKKQLIIDYICSVCDIMDPSNLNSKRYHRLLDSMSDKEFDQWMQYVKDGKWKIHIVAPNLVVTLKNENSLKAADKVKCKLFHRLWMTDDSTGRQYLTDNEYLVLNLPVRRQQQFLDEKMSVPDNDKQIDGLTGQVTGDSKSSSVTNPEIQILAARGLDATLEEFVNVRGGNIAAYSDFKRQAEETGEIKLNSLDQNTRSRVAVVGQVLLRSMMIENNIVE